jgi:hypothetical protein
MVDHVPRNDARWQNALFYECCYNWAAFRIWRKMGLRDGDTKGIIIIVVIIINSQHQLAMYWDMRF